jgi:hypothetical protein
METTIRINTDNLSQEVVDSIKKMFPHKMVDITIQPSDATEYILENENYSKELQERIETYESKKEAITIKMNDLI